MARFKTIMIETGVAIVDSTTGQKTITLDSPYLSKPAISLTIAPDRVNSTVDPGSEAFPSFNANAFVSGVSNASGFWTFTINTESLGNIDDTISPANDSYKNIQFNWRAIGPVSAT